MILKNKYIIVTGAGRGIGKAIAEKCSKEGAVLALISRTQSELEDTLKIVGKFSARSFYLTVDISDEAGVESAVSEIAERFPKIDVLINNAGVQPPIGPFYSNNLKDWKKNVQVNLFGTINMTYFVLRKMIGNKKGKIINLSGGGAASPRPNFSAYAAAKSAIVRFTEILAVELENFNIEVNAVAPGAINTRMMDEVIHARELSGHEYADTLKRKEQGGCSPELAADLIAFLASRHSDGITGKLISAPWDPWHDEDFLEDLKANKDRATLRRIDNNFFTRKP